MSKRFFVPHAVPWRPRPARLAVAEVDLEVAAGEALALVGESGSGKTTLGRLLVGLSTPSSGEIRWEGKALADRLRRGGDIRRELQMIFQDPEASLDPRQRIGDAVAEPLLAYGLATRRSAPGQVAELFERVGLSGDLASRYPFQLSGGQKQRVAIARALAPQPRLLVADEPVSALDASVRGQILNLLSDLQRSLGLSLVYIAHDLDLVGAVADRLAVMYLGRIVESGPTDLLLDSPGHPYTATLLAVGERRGADGAATKRPVEGGASSSDAEASGCPFYPRCRLARPHCQAARPTLVPTAEGRRIACHAHGSGFSDLAAASGARNFWELRT